MKARLTLILLATLFLSNYGFAQKPIPQPSCGVVNPTNEEDLVFIPEKSFQECAQFANTYIENCSEIYIRTNVHFFVTDDCEGLTSARANSDRKEQSEVFLVADRYLQRTNTFLERLVTISRKIKQSGGLLLLVFSALGLDFC